MPTDKTRDRVRLVGEDKAPESAPSSQPADAAKPAEKKEEGFSLFKVALFVGVAAGIGYYLGRRSGLSSADAAAAAMLAKQQRELLEAEADGEWIEVEEEVA